MQLIVLSNIISQFALSEASSLASLGEGVL